MQIINQTELRPGDVFLMAVQGDFRLGKVEHITKSGSIRYTCGYLEAEDVTEDNVIYWAMRDLAPVEKHDTVKYLQKPWEGSSRTNADPNATKTSWAKSIVLMERDGYPVSDGKRSY